MKQLNAAVLGLGLTLAFSGAATARDFENLPGVQMYPAEKCGTRQCTPLEKGTLRERAFNAVAPEPENPIGDLLNDIDNRYLGGLHRVKNRVFGVKANVKIHLSAKHPKIHVEWPLN